MIAVSSYGDASEELNFIITDAERIFYFDPIHWPVWKYEYDITIINNGSDANYIGVARCPDFISKPPPYDESYYLSWDSGEIKTVGFYYGWTYLEDVPVNRLVKIIITNYTDSSYETPKQSQTFFVYFDHANGPLISDIEDKIFNAPVNSVYFVPTGNIYDDSAMYAFYAYKKNPQNIAQWWDFYGDGEPKFTENIVAFGGRYANRMVRYFEDAGIALIGFVNNGTHLIFRRISDGAHIYAVDNSTYNADEKDYFVFQVYKDGDQYIFNEWGIHAEGTYAGGVCFIDIIYPNLQDYMDQYYIFSWTDSDNDDIPQAEEITLETSGS